MRNYIKNLFVAGLLLICSGIFAGELQPITGILKSTNAAPILRGDSVEIYVDTVADTKDYLVKNIISLNWDQNTDTFLLNPTTVKVLVTIYRWNRLGVSMGSRYDTLSVSDNNRYARQTIDRAALKIDNGYRVIVRIDSIYINNVSKTILPRFVSVESEIRLNRFYKFSTVVNTPISIVGIDSSNTDCSADSVKDEITFRWASIAQAEEYQVEWTYVNDYGIDSTTSLSTSQLIANFKNNSTRITTTDFFYSISLAYERGYIAFRVRAVGRDYLNPETYMFNVWSNADSGLVSGLNSDAVFYNWNAHEKIKNWQYSATFAEEGKKKEVISYFDGSLHNRQSVTKVNSDKNAIVGETLYDFQGRPAINVLPTPVTFPSCVMSSTASALKFYPKYNRNLAHNSFTKNDFDLDDSTGACDPIAYGMDTLSGSSLYYSPHNPDKSFQQGFVPDAELFPFSQVEYTPDNTGRIRTQSGVGKKFQLGSGHETKYFYGQPNQIQVDRLFGSEAGDASHYKKNVVLDAHGQASVSYMNQEGKTIATALAGKPPLDENGVYMDSLTSAINSADTLSIDLFNKNSSGQSSLNKITPLQDGIEFSTQILVTYNSTYKFNYDLNVTNLEDACLREDLCMSCIYDLEIKITDECGNNLTVLGTYNDSTILKKVGHLDSIPDGFTMNCDDITGSTVADSITIDLTPGVYTVSKVLTLDKDARDFYVKNYADSIYNSCTETLHDFIVAEMAALDTSACQVTCEECAASLGTKDDYVSSGRGTEIQYDMLYKACMAPCTEITLCQTSFDLMVLDVTLGGQYGTFNETTLTATDPLSVFNVDNIHSAQSQNWKHPKFSINGSTYLVYVDDDGNRTKIAVQLNDDLTTYTPQVDDATKVYTDAVSGEFYTYPENLKNLSDLVPVWRSHFAHSLVVYHPEYAYYRACSEQGLIQTGDTLSSDTFDSLLIATETFAQAVTNGFIKSTYANPSISPTDKVYDFFSNVPGHIYDPFFTNSDFGLSILRPDGLNQTLSHSIIKLLMENSYDNYVVRGTVGHSMVETAAALSRCGNDFNAVPTGTCMAFGTNYFSTAVPNYAHKNDSVRNKEWNMLKTFYLSEKRKIQFYRMDFYAKYYNWSTASYEGGCNSCISNASFSASTGGMLSPYLYSNFPAIPALNHRQPCSYFTAPLYSTTQKRFISPANSGLETQNVPYLMYQQTGQCPMAYLVQTMLNGMAQDSLLNSSTPVDMNTVSTFTIDMYNLLNGTSTPSLFINYQYVDTVASSLLKMHIRNPTTLINKCDMQLDISASAISGFNEIKSIQNLTFDHYTAPFYYFNASAGYGDSTLTTNITGRTTMNIKDCNFEETCTANQFAADMQNLMSMVMFRGQISSIHYNISDDTLISPFITPAIKNMLGTVTGDLYWAFTAPERLTIYDTTNTTTKIRITNIGVDVYVASPAVMFGNIKSNHNNLFEVGMYDSLGVLVALLKGKAEKITPAGTTGISMGDCGLPEAPECELKEHHVRNDLEVLLNDVLSTKPFPADINLFSYPSFTFLLQSYLTPEDTSTITNQHTSSHGIERLQITASNPHSCSLSLLHTLGIAFDSLIAVTNLTATGTPDAYGNLYDFYFVGMYDSSGVITTDTVTGSSCWPLKNCNHCDSANITPIASDTTTLTVPEIYIGWGYPPPGPVTAIDTADCMTLYGQWIAAINNYNASAYAIFHNDSLYTNLYTDSASFMNSGYCECVEFYINDYLDDYIIALTSSLLPLPMDIDHVAELGCSHTYGAIDNVPCNQTYVKYLSASNAYNSFVNGSSDPLVSTYPLITILSGANFKKKYCYCGDKFAANLTAIINGYHPDTATVRMLITLDLACSTAPCVPQGPDTAFVFPVYPYSPNPCVQQAINLALLNAQNTYEQYVDSVSTDIGRRYTEHCLNPLENFTYRYTDREYHYTLYYYDQAGNLVKTIPPEGVQLLDIDDTDDALETQIKFDRDNNQQNVFTDHRMATNYEYNSLNQLTFQDMPDHDKLNLIDFTLPNGLDSRLQIVRTQFVNANKGYLTGYIVSGVKGLLYTTDNGGANWRRVNNTVAATINDISFGSSTTGFAVGEKATILKTTDGGNTWTERNLHYTYLGDFYAAYFGSASNGVIGGAVHGSYPGVYWTSNGGTSYTAGSGFALGDTITDITYDGNFYFATVKSGAEGKIYKSSDSHSWTEATKKRAGNLRKVHYMSHTSGSLFAYAVGEDGTLLKSAVNNTSSWNLVETNVSKPFLDVYFKNENEGIAIIDSASNKGQIWKTTDSGMNWELISTLGDYYTSLQEYAIGKIYASGENGLISRVIMTLPPYAVVQLPPPSLTNDIRHADAVMNSGIPQFLAVGNNDTVYYKLNAGNNSESWKRVDATSLGVSGGDGDYKKIQLKNESGTLLTGALLTQTGKVYRMYKNGADLFDFDLATVQDLSSTPISSYFFNDVTMDTHESTKFYAFDTISKRAFIGTMGGSPSYVLTLTYADTTTAQQGRMLSIAVDSAAGNIVLAGYKGNLKHKNGANTTNMNYSNRTFGVKAVPLNSIAVNGSNEVYAAGNDGSIWTTNDDNTWKLLNTGMTNNINVIRINNGTDSGALACDAGMLYKQFISDSLNIALTAVDINQTDDLTALSLNDSIAYVGTSEGAIVHVSDINTGDYSNVNVKDMLGSFNTMAFVPSSLTVYAAGTNAAFYQCFGNNSARVNDLFLPPIAGASFSNANNGYLTTQSGDIRHTTDGGTTWKIVVPTTGSTFQNIYAVKPDQAILMGSNNHFSVINGETTPSVVTLSGGPSAALLYNIDFNKNGYGILVGSKRAVYSVTPSGSSFTVTAHALPPTLGGGDYVLGTLKVFNDSTFLTAGSGGRIFYCKGNTFYRQNNYAGIADTSTSIFMDMFFHDDRTVYLVGQQGIALKCTLTGNIQNTGYGNVPFSMIWDTLHLSDPFSKYNNSNKSTIDIYTIDFVDRHHGFVGGFYNTAPANPNYAMLIDDNSGYYSTRFFYDKLGRMVVSQNSRQYNKVPKAFSYTRYDALGRIKEVGEKAENTDSLQFRKIFGSYVNNLFNVNTIDDDSLNRWVAGDGLRTEVTHTYYDTTVFSLPLVQEHLRKRVTDVTYEDIDDAVDSTYQHATHYTYDIHGNVRSLLQDNQKMFDTAVSEASVVAYQRFKRIDYEYDLISGKVNKVIYQPDAPDLFIHKYVYDADNRITKVETSTDGIIYDMDAKYFYYAHGPLARVEYGKNQVQGVDYAYTLQGWIKGVNSNSLNAWRDMGRDGADTISSDNSTFARDAYGYTLGYFGDDYKAIDRLKWNPVTARFEAQTAGAEFLDETHDLFNGNISHMATTLVQRDTLSPSGLLEAQTAMPRVNAYKYDQLNRLKKSLAFNNINIPGNLWEASGQTVNHMFENTFTYDGNGNILTQNRYDDAGVRFENMDYRYRKDISGNMLQNRLYHINDGEASGLRTDDIDNQGAFDATAATLNLANNYGYDEIGNMVRDSTEEIDTILWTVYGKIKKIERSAGSSKKNLKFDYDASGNRIAKHVLSSANDWESSLYYVRDAQGNVMSTYKHQVIDTAMSYVLQTTDLYGSSRIGMVLPEKEMLFADTTAEFAFDTLHKRQYELSNHLGNVLTIVYDRKIALDTNSDLTIDFRQVDIAGTWDYSPFGATLMNRLCYNDTIGSGDPDTLVLNTFEEDTGDFGDDGICSLAQVGEQLEVSCGTCLSSDINWGANIEFFVNSGTSYRFAFDITACSSLIKVVLKSNLGVVVDTMLIPSLSSGHYYFDYTPSTSGIYYLYFLKRSAGSCTFYLDNVSVSSGAIVVSHCESALQNYRYGFNGKEKDDEAKGDGNSYDFGDRMQEPRLGRWMSIDSKFGKYPAYSPYNFAVNSPTNIIDMDGNDIYLLSAATSYSNNSGNSGHTMIAVDNYKQIQENRYDNAGKVIAHKGDWEPDGTVTVYDLNTTYSPGKETYDKDFQGVVKSRIVSKQDVLNGRLKEKLPFDGVIEIKTGYDTDSKAKDKLRTIQTEVNTGKTKFNGIKYNCSTFAADVINDVPGFESVTGKEDINPTLIPKQEVVVTPNKLFTETFAIVAADKTKGGAKRLSDKLKKDFIDAYTNGALKDKTPGK